MITAEWGKVPIQRNRKSFFFGFFCFDNFGRVCCCYTRQLAEQFSHWLRINKKGRKKVTKFWFKLFLSMPFSLLLFGKQNNWNWKRLREREKGKAEQKKKVLRFKVICSEWKIMSVIRMRNCNENTFIVCIPFFISFCIAWLGDDSLPFFCSLFGSGGNRNETKSENENETKASKIVEMNKGWSEKQSNENKKEIRANWNENEMNNNFFYFLFLRPPDVVEVLSISISLLHQHFRIAFFAFTIFMHSFIIIVT